MNAAQGRKPQDSNDPRRLTLLIGAALFLFGVLLLAVVAYAGWSADRTAVLRERQQIENALDNSVSRVLDEQKSIAWWDDAITNLTQGHVNFDWADVEFGAFLHETYHHDDVFVLNERDEPVYAYVAGQRVDPEAGYAPERAVIEKVVAEARGRASALGSRARVFAAGRNSYRETLGGINPSWSGHILSLNGKPAVISAITILPNVTPSLLKGEPYLLVSVVHVDDTFMQDVGGALLLHDLTLRANAPSGRDGVAAEPFTADDGAPLGLLIWTPRQPGKTLIVFILPLVALGVALAGVMTALMIARLKRASAALAEREAEARWESMHDPLSGLPNRRQFSKRLYEELDAFVQTRNGRRVVVAYIDVDRFKDVNDTLGHHAGDALIRSVAERLRGIMGPHDLLARFGGDEFAVMRAPATPTEAVELAALLRAAFLRSFDVLGQDVQMSASIGVAQAPQHGLTPEELMRHADIALYQAKAQGRDRAVLFDTEMAAAVEQRREIEVQLRAAIEAHDLSLHYQPLISCAKGAVSGLEALLRWRHPEKGDISPAVFVPIAEEAGLMPELGAWVIERAFSDAARWPDLEIALNLSPVQFRHVELAELLQRLVAKHEVDPSRIVLEVTEGVLLESTDRNRSILEAIRAMGFKIALDDFGTGYSSLRYLSDFRFDKIKIDRAFVTSIDERKRAMTIIQSIVTLGRGLGMEIVAEGVETEAEASAMRLLGVTQLQGFYFSRPVEADQVAGVAARFAAANAMPAAASSASIAAIQRTG